MYTIDETFSYTYEIKRSKFLSYLTPYKEFEALLERLRKEHPKARHFVNAFRAVNEYDQIVEGSSDDGEPKGTSGRPTLHVLQGHALVDAAIVTVRYFGGIKLGTGGLVRAYTEAANGVIESASFIPYVKKEEFVLICDYGNVRQVEYTLRSYDIDILSSEFRDSVFYRLSASKELQNLLRSALDGIAHIPHRQEDTKSK